LVSETRKKVAPSGMMLEVGTPFVLTKSKEAPELVTPITGPVNDPDPGNVNIVVV
jgi:hypothetical protein